MNLDVEFVGGFKHAACVVEVTQSMDNVNK